MSKIFLVSKPNLWSKKLNEMLINSGIDFLYFTDDLYINQLDRNKPDWVFFFHWSKIVPSKIYNNHKCVVFHTANLPKGRGGSPLQNQIMEGVIETKVNAITMEKELDSGAIYCSLPLTLQGTITDIWLSLTDRVHNLIIKCINQNPKPIKQKGKPKVYKRNKKNKLPLNKNNNLIDIYKFIQMLDGDSYPKAFLDIGNFKLEFSRAKFSDEGIISDVLIKKRINDE